ncbi:unnamed protein product [Closterium sp. NIES-54]
MDVTGLRHRIHEAYKSTAEMLLSARSATAFAEKGVLTPDEFVAAGDNLVAKCPTWSWEGADPSRRRSFLPPDKQYLITRNVPCLRRVGAMEEEVLLATGGSETLVDADVDGDGNEPWVATSKLGGASSAAAGAGSAQQEFLPSIDAPATSATGGGGEGGGAGAGERTAGGAAGGDEEEEDDVPDIAEFDDVDNVVDADPVSACVVGAVAVPVPVAVPVAGAVAVPVPVPVAGTVCLCVPPCLWYPVCAALPVPPCVYLK